MKSSLGILLGLLLSFYSQAESQKLVIDSIQQIIQDAQHDSIIVNGWIAWSEQVDEDSIQLAIELLNKADKLSQSNLDQRKLSIKEKLFFQQAQGDINYKIGWHLYQNYFYTPDSIKTLHHFYKSLELRQATGEKSKIAESFDRIGDCYYYLRRYDKALSYYGKYIAIHRELDNYVNVAYGILHQGSIFRRIRKLGKAVAYNKRGLELLEDINDEDGILYAIGKLVLTYEVKADYNEAIFWCEKGLQKAKEFDNQNSHRRFQSYIGVQYHHLGDYDKALVYYNNNLDVLKSDLSSLLHTKAKNAKLEQIALQTLKIGEINLSQGNLAAAMERSYESLHVYEKLNHEDGMSFTYNSIGNIYLIQKEYTNAEHHYKKALDLSVRPDVKAFALKGIGDVLKAQNQFVKALEYYEKSTQVAEAAQDKFTLSEIYGNIGSIYLFQKKFNMAMKYLGKSLELSQQIGAKSLEGLALQGLGKCYSKIGKITKAIAYNQRSLALGKEEKEQLIIQNAAKTLYEDFKKQKKYDQALAMYEQYIAAKDSLTSEINLKEVIRQEYKYVYDKQAFADSIQYLEIKKVKDAQLATQRAINAQQRQRSYFLLGGGLFALLFGVWMYNRVRVISKQNQIILNQKQQLERLNQTKDNIFAIIGHDLRKPAIAFRGVTKKINYLLKQQDFVTLNRLGEEIEKDSFALNKLIDNLLNWALMQKNVMPYHPEMVSIATIVNEEIAIFEKIRKEKGITLNTSIAEQLKVYADQNALRTIIRNLIDNAIKFTANYGDITITASNRAKGVQLAISDSGIGMSKEQVKYIFLLQKGKSKKGLAGEKGTGLGMHLVNELVKINQGTIDVFSQLDNGTTFNVVLPNSA